MKTRTVSKKMSMGELFDNLGVEDKAGAVKDTNYDVRVKTPNGYKPVARFFRTEEQKSVRVYFGNGSTLECSWDHRLKANGRWQKVKDLEEDDQVETEKGTTTKVSEIKEKSKEKALYDMSVEDVHCYYSNGVLSHNSWILSTLGANAMENGKNIVHYTLELSENQTGFRYDSIFTDYAPNEVQDHKEEVLSELQHIQGNASIQYWPTKGASTQTIRGHLDRMATVRWKPDLILIDYADLLRPLGAQRSDGNYEQMGNIYEDLRKLSGEVGIPIWTVSQTQRQAVREKVVKGDRIADSWKKAMTADFICSLSRTDTDKVSETARFHVIKSRFGPDGKTYPAIMSTSTGNVRIFDPEKEEGKRLLAKMDENEGKQMKEELSKEYQKWKFKEDDRKKKTGGKTKIGV